MTFEFSNDEAAILHAALVAYQAKLSPTATVKADAVAKLLTALNVDDFKRKSEKSKVKAPAVPAVDWGTAKPAKKAKAIPMPGKPVLEKAKSLRPDRPAGKSQATRKG